MTPRLIIYYIYYSIVDILSLVEPAPPFSKDLYDLFLIGKHPLHEFVEHTVFLHMEHIYFITYFCYHIIIIRGNLIV